MWLSIRLTWRVMGGEMWERMLKRSTNEVIVPSRYIVRWLGDVLEYIVCFTLIDEHYILFYTYIIYFFSSFFYLLSSCIFNGNNGSGGAGGHKGCC